MSLRLLCLPGDGIGPEIVAAARAVLEAACAGAGRGGDAGGARDRLRRA